MLTSNVTQRNFDEEAITAEDELVSVCAGLVTVDRESQTIRLVHHTTQRYFERVRCEKTPSSQVEIQIDMAKACITYLGFDEFESHEFTYEKMKTGISDEIHSKNPFLDYAGKNWGHHARGAPEDIIGDMIWRLLERKSTLFLACQLIDDTSGTRNYGPIPGITLLIIFGLERMVSRLKRFGENQGPKCAIRVRYDTLVFFLVEHDADWYDVGHYYFEAAVSFFELEGNETMVKLLADKGVMVDLGVDNGEFLFYFSIFKVAMAKRINYTAPEVTWSLGELGAKVDPDNLTFYTPLMRAVIGGDGWSIPRLLLSGADVKEKNERGRDALIYAALARHERVVKPLLEAGADVHSRDKDGMTALCAACQAGSENTVKLLLENGADVTAQDKYLRTPISIATESGHAPLLRLLRDPGTNTRMKELQFDPMYDLFEPHRDSDSREIRAILKSMESHEREMLKWGFHGMVPTALTTFFKTKASENESANVEEEEMEPLSHDSTL